jgi:hypothetical protein
MLYNYEHETGSFLRLYRKQEDTNLNTQLLESQVVFGPQNHFLGKH